MLKNNIEIDFKVKCIDESTTQAKIAETVGTSPQYVSRLINNQENIVNKTFLSMMEALGYDVELPAYFSRYFRISKGQGVEESYPGVHRFL